MVSCGEMAEPHKYSDHTCTVQCRSKEQSAVVTYSDHTCTVQCRSKEQSAAVTYLLTLHYSPQCYQDCQCSNMTVHTLAEAVVRSQQGHVCEESPALFLVQTQHHIPNASESCTKWRSLQSEAKMGIQ